MTKKTDTPAIRFKGFSDTWEQRKLNSIADVRDGTHASPQYFSTGHPFITSKNVKDGYINYDDVQYISDEDFEEINKRSKVDVNDILMGMIGTIGNLALIREAPDFAIKNVALIKDTGAIFYLYLYHCLQSETVLNQLSENMDGGTQKFVALKRIRELNIAFPSKPEQEAIGSYFRNLDRLITLHQRKYEKLHNIKKSMLEKMFPKNGSNIPEIRFKGFTEAWEQRKLNSIADVRDGTHASPQYFSTGHPFITSKNVKDGYINYDDVQYISDEDFEEINKRSKVDVNDILMGMIGTIGNLALIREAPDFAIKNVALIKDTGAIFYLYLYHCLQSETVLNQLSENMDGGTQKFVALKRIRELNIAFPSKPEQEAIGSYFRNLDRLITLHQRELEKLQNIKKSMLEKMFV